MRIINNDQMACVEIFPQAFFYFGIVITAVVPHPLYKTEIDFFRAPLPHIMTDPSEINDYPFDNTPETEVPGKIEKDDGIGSREPDIQCTIVGTVDNPFARLD